MELKIKEEFKKLIPPLTAEEFKQLETNCIAEGIRESIITWQGFIIDGHNRYEIAKSWELNFKTTEKHFDTEQDVIEWMILNQFGRRNLSNYQRSVLALELEEVFEKKAKANQGKRTDILVKSPKSLDLFQEEQPEKKPIEIKPIDTRKELSKIAGVGEQTISRVKIIEQKAAPKVKEKLSTGELSINQAYQDIKKEEKKIELEYKKEQYIESFKSEIKNTPEIYNIDAVNFLNTFNDNSIDLLVTDPPYATDINNIEEFTKEWLSIALNKVKKSGRIYICSGAYPIEIKAFLDVLLNQNKFIVDNPLIWTYRNTLGITPKMKYNLNYQMIWHLYSNDSKELDTSITNEMFSVQDINAPDGRIGNRLHTWQKPDELAHRLIRHSSKENDLVVDCFCCTGTFLIAASKLNRIAKGCDINIDNLQIAKNRGCTIIGQ